LCRSAESVRRTAVSRVSALTPCADRAFGTRYVAAQGGPPIPTSSSVSCRCWVALRSCRAPILGYAFVEGVTVCVAATLCAVAAVSTAGAVANAAANPGVLARPDFRAPWPYDQVRDYYHHSAEVSNAIDYNFGGSGDLGTPALASAAGTVTSAGVKAVTATRSSSTTVAGGAAAWPT
jgi:hypothetical protein